MRCTLHNVPARDGVYIILNGLDSLKATMSKPLPKETVDSPQAWIGKIMTASDSWIRAFSQAEIAELETAAISALRTGNSVSEWRRGDFLFALLEKPRQEWLEEFSYDRGFMLLREEPVDECGFEDQAEIMKTDSMAPRAISDAGIPVQEAII